MGFFLNPPSGKKYFTTACESKRRWYWDYGKFCIISKPDSHLHPEILNRLYSRHVSVSWWLEPHWCDIIYLLLLEDDSVVVHLCGRLVTVCVVSVRIKTGWVCRGKSIFFWGCYNMLQNILKSTRNSQNKCAVYVESCNFHFIKSIHFDLL